MCPQFQFYMRRCLGPEPAFEGTPQSIGGGTPRNLHVRSRVSARTKGMAPLQPDQDLNRTRRHAISCSATPVAAGGLACLRHAHQDGNRGLRYVSIDLG